MEGLVQIIFLSKWVICRFQPLIFQGVPGWNFTILFFLVGGRELMAFLNVTPPKRWPPNEIKGLINRWFQLGVSLCCCNLSNRTELSPNRGPGGGGQNQQWSLHPGLLNWKGFHRWIHEERKSVWLALVSPNTLWEGFRHPKPTCRRDWSIRVV